MFKPATYVSVWDGDTEIRTSCLFNPETKTVKDIETMSEDIEDLNFCSREFIEQNEKEYDEFYSEDTGCWHLEEGWQDEDFENGK